VDRVEDDISCGPGDDVAKANPGDDIETELGRCERVIRTGRPVGDGPDPGGG
jgi:hypothetical protein